MSTNKLQITLPLEAMYRDHHGWLKGWLHHRLGCGHQAADLTQDTFERVLVNADVDHVREPRPWLLTIAKRLLIDRSRRAKVEQAFVKECSALMRENPALAPSAEAVFAAVEALEKIATALDKLPDNARHAFVLRYLDNLTLVEIAERLDVSHTMVRKYLVQVLAACHQIIEPQTV